MLIKVDVPFVRMLEHDEAAAYCGIKKTRFTFVCPVRPVKLHDSLRPMWDVQDLNKWIDNTKSGGLDFSTDEIVERL